MSVSGTQCWSAPGRPSGLDASKLPVRPPAVDTRHKRINVAAFSDLSLSVIAGLIRIVLGDAHRWQIKL